MNTSTLLRGGRSIQVALRRNYGVTTILFQKVVDPIQQLFLEKIREYTQKKKAAGGKLVDVTPEIERQLNQELDKVARQYGGGKGVDMTKFPTFKFEEPKIDPQI